MTGLRGVRTEHQLSRIEVHTARGVEVWGYDYDPFGRRVAKYRLPAEYATPTQAANDDPAPLPGEKRKRPVPLARAAYLARHAPETVHFGWEGNRLLSERRGDRQQLYLYEDDSFVPLMLVRSALDTASDTAVRTAAHSTADADAALNAALYASGHDTYRSAFGCAEPQPLIGVQPSTPSSTVGPRNPPDCRGAASRKQWVIHQVRQSCVVSRDGFLGLV